MTTAPLLSAILVTPDRFARLARVVAALRAQGLRDRIEGPWDGVGTGVGNANPRSGASWSMLFLDFGPWVLPAPPGPAKLLPSHRTAYKRDILLTYGDALGGMLETETTLQQDMTARGHALYFEPAARTDHVNARDRCELLDGDTP